VTVRIAHTACLTSVELNQIRGLLEASFGARFDGADWEHALGGLHLVVAEAATADAVSADAVSVDASLAGVVSAGAGAGADRPAARVVAHASVVQRRLIHGGVALRTGYVEAVAVAPDRRGRGYAAALMRAAEGVIARAYQLGALSAADGVSGLYTARGWVRWQGPTRALTPEGTVRTPDEDDSTYVYPVVGTALDVTGALTCDWRDGDVW
jgi:aminoglycoside 2'-N-acetyltransferase I